MVPGIGSVFAKRIIKYRDLLGGFYSVEQLGEVYGIDEERYEAMKSWFSVDPSVISHLFVNQLSAKELASHPYVSYKQARIIEKMIKKREITRLGGFIPIGRVSGARTTTITILSFIPLIFSLCL